MDPKRFRLWLTLAGLALAGCAGTSPPPVAGPGRAAPAASTDPWQSLTRGMTADQVRASLGAPHEVRPMQTAGGEIWVYRRSVNLGVDLVATRMEDMPYVDPVTGEQRSMQSPVYSQESRVVEQDLNLLMFEGKLVSWKAIVRQKRQFTD